MLKRFNDIIMKGLNWLIIFLGGFLVVLVFFQVLNRFLFKIPVPWTEEIARYVFVWLSLTAAAKAVREKTHIFVDIVEALYKGKATGIMGLVAQVFSIFFFIILAITGWVWSKNNLGNYCETVKLDLFLVYMVVPLSALLMLLFGLENFIDDLKKMVSKGGAQ